MGCLTLSNNKRQNGYKNVDDTDLFFEPNNQDINNALKEQHTLDFYNDDMSRKAVKSMFEINNENFDDQKNDQKKTYGYSGTNKHNTFSKPSKPVKQAESVPSKPPKTDKYGNIEYTGVSFDYEKFNNEVKQGYRYGGSKKDIDFRNTAFSVEKLNAEKRAREEAEFNKQKLKQLELEERSKPRYQSSTSEDISNSIQYKTVGEVQQSFETMPIRRVNPTNNNKRKQIMSIRIATTFFVILLLVCLVVNILANTKLKSQITTLTEENTTLKQENLKVAGLDNEIAILKDELAKLKASGVPEPEPTAPVPEANKPKEYVVKGGDSLSSISKQFYGDASRYNEIVSANNLSTTTLFAGQKLIIP